MDLSEIAGRVGTRKEAWASADRAAYARRVLDALTAVAERWVEDACAAHGTDAATEWLEGPAALARALRLVLKPPRVRAGGVARVHPATVQDRLARPGVTVDAMLTPRESPPLPGVSVVTVGRAAAAGSPVDVMREMFVLGRVAVVAVAERDAWLLPHLEQLLAPLAGDGFVAFAREPLPATAEARGPGAPLLIVPGPWAAGDIAFQARHVAYMVARADERAAVRTIVSASGWLQRPAFFRELQARLAAPALTPASASGSPPAAEAPPRYEAVVLEADDAPPFLAAAVSLANERFPDAPSCCLLAHPYTVRDHRAALDAAAAALRHPEVVLNAPPGTARALAGACAAEKTTLRARFWSFPLPHLAHGPGVGRALLRYEAAPSLGGALSVAAMSLRG
jgi:hypothetical protein